MAEATNDVERALTLLETIGLEAGRSGLAPLLTTSGAARAAKDPRFRMALAPMLERIRSDAPDRVQQLALAWRLTSVTAMREIRRGFIQELARGVAEFDELPNVMSDPDDRRHFADAMSHVHDPWISGYLAKAIVEEREGEKARDGLARALVANASDLSALLQAVTPHILSATFDQQEPAAGRARRVAAVLDSIGAAAWSSDADVAAGERLGATLGNLVSSALARRPTVDRAASFLAARSVFDFVITTVRLHGTLAAQAETYALIEPLRRYLGGGHWPEELAPQLARASGQVLDQLVFLVRLKMPDAQLRRIFIGLAGEGLGQVRLDRISTDPNSGLDPEGAYWLRTGAARRSLPTQTAVAETAVAAVDRELALSLREADTLRTNISAIAQEVQSAAEFASPRLAEDVQSFFRSAERLVTHVLAAARRRDLVLKGEPGEVVPFSPLEHEPVDGAVGSRIVRLRSRIVERSVDGRSGGVVIRGDVEAAQP